VSFVVKEFQLWIHFQGGNPMSPLILTCLAVVVLLVIGVVVMMRRR
jgi:hypothetical protein